MNIIDLYVPDGTPYLNEWKDKNGQPFCLPCGILDKGIPNCGATTLALEDCNKTIICSPRNNLIENKHAQHDGTLLVVGRMSEDEIRRYLSETATPKILVSYDSLPKVSRCIADKSGWRVVVDEFQYLLTDSGFKSEVEKRLIETTKGFDYVTYLSATPILDKYLRCIEFFKDIPYYRLNWNNVEKVRVIRKRSANPIATALEIIRAYKDGHYPCIEIDGKTIFSTECIIFLNSVENIAKLIIKSELSADEVNIIVGNSEENDKKIAKIGGGFRRGRLPLKGEPHKKFTFCTSTAFAGCDFYSTVASSFVICDPMRSNTTIDIATDLVQIAGRQRLAQNPFRKFITMVYKVGDFERSEDEFTADLERRRRLTESEIADVLATSDPELREKKIKDIVRLQKMCNFSETFTMYNADSNEVLFNDFAYISQRYVYDLQKYNYANGITVRNILENSGFALQGNQTYEASDDYAQQMEHLITAESFADKMKNYCELRDNNCIYALTLNNIESRFPQLKLFYEELGSERIRALGYKEKELKNDADASKILVDEPIAKIDLLHYGWNIGLMFGKSGLQIAYFLKSTFGHHFDRLSLVSISKKLTMRGSCIIIRNSEFHKDFRNKKQQNLDDMVRDFEAEHYEAEKRAKRKKALEEKEKREEERERIKEEQDKKNARINKMMADHPGLELRQEGDPEDEEMITNKYYSDDYYDRDYDYPDDDDPEDDEDDEDDEDKDIDEDTMHDEIMDALENGKMPECFDGFDIEDLSA